MRRRRFRTWAKWACTLAAGLCVTAAVVSGFWLVEYANLSRDGNTVWWVGVRGGMVVVERQSNLLEYGGGVWGGWIARRSHYWTWGLPSEPAPIPERAAGHPGI